MRHCDIVKCQYWNNYYNVKIRLEYYVILLGTEFILSRSTEVQL